MKPYSPVVALLLFAGLLTWDSAAAASAPSYPYTQPPVVQWHQPPRAATAEQPPAAPAAPAATPASEPVHGIKLAPPVAETPAAPVAPVASAPQAPVVPVPPAAPPGGAAAILAFQAENQDPGTFQPILGAEASRSYARYLKSFTQPIPQSFAPSVGASGGAAASMTAAGAGGGYGSAQ